MTSQTDHGTRLLNQLDPLLMLGAIVTLFIALGTESWWTLRGATISGLFNIQISPFYVHIDAVGMPATLPLAGSLGSLTRTVLLVGFLALFAASIRPNAWWRNLAIYCGLSSLAELYLSFFLMYYWTETALVNTYGVLPSFYGTSTLQANIIGLDLNYYPSPQVAAAFGVPYYLGFLSLGLIIGRSLITVLHERAFHVIATLLSGGAIHDVYLTPPYNQVWFSSRDREFNPMQTDPETLDDGELLTSFQKLYDTVEPGGSLSIILPDLATTLADRLEELMPQTGFTIEKAGVANRTSGKPEKELRFRKPHTSSPLEHASEPPSEPVSPRDVPPSQQIIETPEKPKPDLTNPASATVESPIIPPIPILETAEAPAWASPKLTRLERLMLKAAIRTITDRKQPVAYRELLNQVYMDLVDHKIEFDSARQIETTLLNHNGREIFLIEEADNNATHPVKKWWLGNQKMRRERRPSFPGLNRVRKATPKLSNLKQVFKRSRNPRRKPSLETEEETSDESTGS